LLFLELKHLPILPLRGMVAFPGSGISFDIIRERSQKALDAAREDDHYIFIVTQKNPMKEYPKEKDVYRIGTVARIKQTIRLAGGVTRVVVEGESRARLEEFNPDGNYLTGTVSLIPEDEEEPATYLTDQAFLRAVENTFEQYLKFGHKVNRELIHESLQKGGIGSVADTIAANSDLRFEQKQKILEATDPYDRMETLIEVLHQETQILEIAKKISDQVKKQMDKNQREYYLREELKVIQKELGDEDGIGAEIRAYREKLEKLNFSEEIREKLEKEIGRLEKLPSTTPDSAVIRNYLDQVFALPWQTQTEETLELTSAEAILERDHYGLEKVKERVLEHLAVHIMTKGKTNSIICLVGPPGTGKTSIAKSVAEALNRKYVRISLGGIHDEADIRGHRKTYIGAMPGRIMEAVRQAGTKNPLILLDEIDKMGQDYKGDPSAALLEVLDREQNFAFRDHYLEVPFDLSGVMFFMTANTLSTIPAPLLDRIEIIELSGYTSEEKFEIAKRYLLPKQLEKQGLSKTQVWVEEPVLRMLIAHYTREAGVRKLESEIESLLRKAAKKLLCEQKKRITVTAKNLESYLGKQKYHFEPMGDRDEVGVVRGLAWTQVGGDTLSVEVNVMPGSGKVELTGKLGEVMKESAMTAVSYIRSQSDALELESDFYKEKDLHIHVPEGAVPKDGPSAGITIATAVASALTNRPVRCDIAMTGEITLRGRVLPIGGLKEKSLAAYRAGIRTVIFPEKNVPDLEEIPENIREEIEFVPVNSAEKVLQVALK